MDEREKKLARELERRVKTGHKFGATSDPNRFAVIGWDEIGQPIIRELLLTERVGGESVAGMCGEGGSEVFLAIPLGYDPEYAGVAFLALLDALGVLGVEHQSTHFPRDRRGELIPLSGFEEPVVVVGKTGGTTIVTPMTSKETK